MYVTLMLIAVVLVGAQYLYQLIKIATELQELKRLREIRNAWMNLKFIIPLVCFLIIVWVALHLGFTIAYGWPA